MTSAFAPYTLSKSRPYGFLFEFLNISCISDGCIILEQHPFPILKFYCDLDLPDAKQESKVLLTLDATLPEGAGKSITPTGKNTNCYAYILLISLKTFR